MVEFGVGFGYLDVSVGNYEIMRKFLRFKEMEEEDGMKSRERVL